MRLRDWGQAETLARHEDKVIPMLTLVIGAIVGLVVLAFILLTERPGARLYPAEGAAWRRLLFPTAGALLTGFLLSRYFPNARGSGIPETKVALFLRNGRILFRTVLGKLAGKRPVAQQGPHRSRDTRPGTSAEPGRRLLDGPRWLASYAACAGSVKRRRRSPRVRLAQCRPHSRHPAVVCVRLRGALRCRASECRRGTLAAPPPT